MSKNASVAQYGPPTPTPTTCVGCAPPSHVHDLPYTGLDVVPLGAGALVLAVVGLVLRYRTRPRR